MANVKQDQINYKKGKISKKQLIDLYEGLLRPRLIEEKMLILLRQGRISKWFSGIGQEAISVGATMALDADELIFTMHRNLGVFTSRNMPLENLFAQWQGKDAGYTKGRDRSFHFGAMEHGIVGFFAFFVFLSFGDLPDTKELENPKSVLATEVIGIDGSILMMN